MYIINVKFFKFKLIVFLLLITVTNINFWHKFLLIKVYDYYYYRYKTLNTEIHKFLTKSMVIIFCKFKGHKWKTNGIRIQNYNLLTI